MPDSSKFIDRRRFAALLGACALAAPAVAQAVPAVTTVSGRAFGTGWRLVLPAGSDTARHAGMAARILARIDRQMSPWRADSDLTLFNAAAAGMHRMPRETLDVAEAALRIAGASGGAFDPTVGPLVARWGFGPIEGDGTPGWTGLAVDTGALRKARSGLTIDLCGIAKGHAIDALADALRAAGETDFLVDLGGELRGSGRHPAGRDWRAGIEDPRPGGGVLAALRLGEGAVATSGSRWNRIELGGEVYSHIIDPRRRAPVAGRLASVTVLARTALEADGWATALMAAGDQGGPDLARKLGLSAGFVLAGPGGVERIDTGGFAAHVLA